MSEHGGSHASYFLVMAMLPKGSCRFTAISSCYEGFIFSFLFSSKMNSVLLIEVQVTRASVACVTHWC